MCLQKDYLKACNLLWISVVRVMILLVVWANHKSWHHTRHYCSSCWVRRVWNCAVLDPVTSYSSSSLASTSRLRPS